MKKLVKNVCVFLLLLCVCAGCRNKRNTPLVAKVTDMLQEGVAGLDVIYDRDGNVIQYGNTPIKYKGDQIIVGAMDMSKPDGKLLEVVFFMGKGRAQESRAHCMLKTESGELEVEKQTIYKYRPDTLIICSDYRAVADRSFVRNVEGKYVFDDKRRIAEVNLVYREANDSVYSRFIRYNYDNNLSSDSNLNLQAYLMEHDGVDSFLFFLLNLAQLSNYASLPNDISAYSFKSDGTVFNLHANYRMIGEKVTRLDVLYENSKLISRIDLSYKNEEQRIKNEE